jgi:pimeloyl-ACP methyl ester carboxylesterase
MKSLKKVFLTLLIIILGWTIFAQFGMKFRMSDKAAIKEFSKAGVPLDIRILDVNGFPLHYAKTGNDSLPTLFFVHGSPGGWIKFKQYLKDKDLLRKFRMIAIDRPGFGYSRFGEIKSLQEQSEIISALLKQIENGKPFYASGTSYGGPMIAKLAVENPGYFTGLVFISASMDPREEKAERWRPAFINTALKYLMPGAWRASNEELWHLKKELPGLVPRLGEIDCEAIILHGDKDKLVPLNNAYFIKKELVNAKRLKLTIVPGGNHFISDHYFSLVKQVYLDLY